MILHKIYLGVLILIVFSVYSMQRNDDEYEDNIYALFNEQQSPFLEPMDIGSETQTTTTSADSANFDLLSGLACDINQAYRAQSNQNPQGLAANLQTQAQTNPENFEEKNNDTNSLMELLSNSTDLSEEKNQEATDSSNQPNLISKKRKDDSEIANSSKKRKTSSRAQQTRRFKCDVEDCDKSYQRPEGLYRHKRGHHGKGYACTVTGCNQIFKDSSILKDHQTTFHGNGYKCDKCNKIYTTRVGLRRHKIGKHGEGFKCNFCGKTFPNEKEIAKHKKKEHSNRQIAEQNLPNNSIRRGENIDSDTQTADSAKFDLLSHFVCDMNQADRAEVNQNPQGLAANLQTQAQTNPENFEEKNKDKNCLIDLVSNLIDLSQKKNPKDADQESTNFVNQNATDSNSQTDFVSKKRKNNSEAVNSSKKRKTSSRAQQTKKFKCTVEDCDKSYKYASGLDAHKRGCHGHGYTCSITGCNKIFKYAVALRDHEVNFHGNGYKCDKCNKVYLHEVSLLNHERGKHGEGFKCKFMNCGKTFTTKKKLIQHKKKFHTTDSIEVSLVEQIDKKDNDIEEMATASVEEQDTKKSEITEPENTANIHSTNNSSTINDIVNEIEIPEKELDNIESTFLETDPDDNYIMAPIEEIEIFEAGDFFEVTDEDNIIIKPTNIQDLVQSLNKNNDSNLQNKQSTIITAANMEEKEPTCKLESQAQTKNPNTKIMSGKLSNTNFEIEALKGSILVLNQMLKNEINNTTKIGIKQMLTLIKNKFGNTQILQILTNSEDKHINLMRLTLETCISKLQKIYSESDDIYSLATEIKTLINSNITSIIVCD